MVRRTSQRQAAPRTAAALQGWMLTRCAGKPLLSRFALPARKLHLTKLNLQGRVLALRGSGSRFSLVCCVLALRGGGSCSLEAAACESEETPAHDISWHVCALASLAAYHVTPGPLEGEEAARGPRTFLQVSFLFNKSVSGAFLTLFLCNTSVSGPFLTLWASSSSSCPRTFLQAVARQQGPDPLWGRQREMYGGHRGAFVGHREAHGEVASRLSVITATQFWVLYTLKDSKTNADPLGGSGGGGRVAEGAVEVLAWRGTDVRRLQDVVTDLDCLPCEVSHHQLRGRFHGGIGSVQLTTT